MPRYPPRDQRFEQEQGERNYNRGGIGVRGEAQEKRDDKRNQPERNEPTGVAINTIAGGDSRGGDSSSSRKSYSREAYQFNLVMHERDEEEPIIFSPADRGDVVTTRKSMTSLLLIEELSKRWAKFFIFTFILYYSFVL